jgi:carbonic anhydrase
MAQEELTVSGWIYEIGAGHVSIAEDGQKAFLPVESDHAAG